MKKKSCLTLALILVMVQLISLFAVVPASAAGFDSTYNIYSADFANFVVDGKATEKEWASIPASSSAQYVSSKTAGDANRTEGFNAFFKAAWAPNATDDTKMDVYIYVEVNDPSAKVCSGHNWNGDGIKLWVYDVKNSLGYWSGHKVMENANGTTANFAVDSGNSTVYQFTISDERATNGDTHYGVEMKLTIDKQTQICFDFMVQDSYSGNGQYNQYYWDNNVGSGKYAAGECSIKEGSFIESTAGASIRVDTATPAQSGIRFATTVDADRIAALTNAGATITTGTLILPTNNLKAGTVFTKEGLAAAGLVEGTHYYDIVNEGNEWVDGKAGTWYGTLFDIKNFTREFSAIGYVTVTIGGVSVTYYGQYEADYARSIAEVATAAKNDNNANWSTEELAILNGFCGN